MGYAGSGIGKNNPKMQHVVDVGPIPSGEYRIGRAHKSATGLGPVVMDLDPVGHNALGRTLFRIQVRRLASEKNSDGAYLQIHRVTFLKKDRSRLIVLTENLAPHTEYSEGPVTVYVVTDVLGEIEH